MGWGTRTWNGLGKMFTGAVKASPVRLWALIGAGPPLTVFAVWLVHIVWKGPWPAGLASQRLQILGWSLYIVLSLLGVMMVSLASARVKATGLAGTSIDIDGADDHEDAVTATTTTQTTLSIPQAPPAASGAQGGTSADPPATTVAETTEGPSAAAPAAASPADDPAPPLPQ